MNSAFLENKEDFKRALKAFNLLKQLSPGELETLEILADPEQRKVIEASLQESRRGNVHPLKSLLK